MKPLRIVLLGGSGQLGHILARWFTGLGRQVTVIARRPASGPSRSVEWNGREPGNWVAAWTAPTW